MTNKLPGFAALVMADRPQIDADAMQCPPCNSDCNQGRECPSQLGRMAQAYGDMHDAANTRRWPVYAAAILALILAVAGAAYWRV